jgi:phosphoserine aminotransferase
VIASSEDQGFSYIPKDFKVDEDAAYLHFTSNNTIKGTQWAKFPESGNVPLCCDMSSDIMSRPFDAKPFGLIYAGAQKNIGPAGTAMVIIRKDMLERVPDNIPTARDSRSLMNVTFRLPNEDLEKRFVAEALEEGLGGLKGHRSVGGCRASIYNATDIWAVKDLVAFMAEFEKKEG